MALQRPESKNGTSSIQHCLHVCHFEVSRAKKTVTEGGELVRVEEGDPGKLARRLLFMQRRV